MLAHCRAYLYWQTERAQRAGEAGSDFTWADLSKAQWGLDWWIHYGPHSTAGTWTNCSSAILLYMLCLPSLGSAYLYREVFCIFCRRYGQIFLTFCSDWIWIYLPILFPIDKHPLFHFLEVVWLIFFLQTKLSDIFMWLSDSSTVRNLLKQ